MCQSWLMLRHAWFGTVMSHQIVDHLALQCSFTSATIIASPSSISMCFHPWPASPSSFIQPAPVPWWLPHRPPPTHFSWSCNSIIPLVPESYHPPAHCSPVTIPPTLIPESPTIP